MSLAKKNTELSTFSGITKREKLAYARGLVVVETQVVHGAPSLLKARICETCLVEPPVLPLAHPLHILGTHLCGTHVQKPSQGRRVHSRLGLSYEESSPMRLQASDANLERVPPPPRMWADIGFAATHMASLSPAAQMHCSPSSPAQPHLSDVAEFKPSCVLCAASASKGQGSDIGWLPQHFHEEVLEGGEGR